MLRLSKFLGISKMFFGYCLFVILYFLIIVVLYWVLLPSE